MIVFETKKTRMLRRKCYDCMARIRELENIICPHESHEYKVTQINYIPIDGNGNDKRTTRKICVKCLKVEIITELA